MSFTARAYRLTAWGQAALQTVEVPEPAGHEVLIRVEAAGVCGSDVLLVDRGARVASYDPPFTLGHELCGVVVATGDTCRAADVGSRVIAAPIWGCGRCPRCFGGFTNYCSRRVDAERNGRRFAMGGGLGLDGCLADYVLVPRAELLVPTDIPPEIACVLTDAGLTAYSAIMRCLDRTRGRSAVAVVIGVGGVGHLAIAILAALTDATLVAVDIDPGRQELAHQMGAGHFFLNAKSTACAVAEISSGDGADVILDCAGTSNTLALAANIAALDGAIAILGLGGGQLPMSIGALPYGCCIYGHSAGSIDELRDLVGLIHTSNIRPVVHLSPLADVDQVIDQVRHGRVRGRAVIVP